MKKFCILFLTFIFIGINTPSFAFLSKTSKEAKKVTKQVKKLSDEGKIDELQEYYSDDYKSHDGYTKEEMLNIIGIAHKLYPNIKTHTQILKYEEPEEDEQFITVYIKESAKAGIKVEGQDAKYASKDKIKGKMDSFSRYNITYKKENGKYKIIKDDISEEMVSLKYGEAIKADLKMDVPMQVASGEEFSALASFKKFPKNRVVVGAIGHDKIIYPPEKNIEPYRVISKNATLERILKTNPQGHNEYVNATFAIISHEDETDNAKNPTVAGMGILIKRINTEKKL